MTEQSPSSGHTILQGIAGAELVENLLLEEARRLDPEDVSLFFGVLNKVEVELAVALAFKIFEGFEPLIGQIWENQFHELKRNSHIWRIAIASMGAARDEKAFSKLWVEYEETYYDRRVAQSLARYAEDVNEMFYDLSKGSRLEQRSAALKVWEEYLKYKQDSASDLLLDQIEPVIRNMASDDRSGVVRESAEQLCEQIDEVRTAREEKASNPQECYALFVFDSNSIDDGGYGSVCQVAVLTALHSAIGGWTGHKGLVEGCHGDIPTNRAEELLGMSLAARQHPIPYAVGLGLLGQGDVSKANDWLHDNAEAYLGCSVLPPLMKLEGVAGNLGMIANLEIKSGSARGGWQCRDILADLGLKAGRYELG